MLLAYRGIGYEKRAEEKKKLKNLISKFSIFLCIIVSFCKIAIADKFEKKKQTN